MLRCNGTNMQQNILNLCHFEFLASLPLHIMLICFLFACYVSIELSCNTLPVNAICASVSEFKRALEIIFEKNYM